MLWCEHLLFKIAKAVMGKPVRAWFVGGLDLLRYAGTEYVPLASQTSMYESVHF